MRELLRKCEARGDLATLPKTRTDEPVLGRSSTHGHARGATALMRAPQSLDELHCACSLRLRRPSDPGARFTRQINHATPA